jgi:glycine/D-amino acid oxidase-like deaminating enzyme
MTSSQPYWWDEAPPRSLPPQTVAASCDVVIVGAGYTGISAAIALARAGRSVQAFDKMRPGEGASTRNGGIASANLRPSFQQMIDRFGLERARAIQAEARPLARTSSRSFARKRSIAISVLGAASPVRRARSNTRA